MADTLRESTARPRSENTSHEAGMGLMPALGFTPHTSTADHRIRQVATIVPPPIREPWFSRIGAAVEKAIALLSDGPGATVSVTDGNMAGRKLYAVSIYPKRSVKLKARPNWRELVTYARKNVAVLLMPGHAFGIWYNEPQIRYELDIVVCLPALAVAIALGRRYRQACIYDLFKGEEIHLSLSTRPSRPSRTGGRNA